MSKLKLLREKYPKITDTSFERFLSGDPTKTKKYLEYMMKIWTDRRYNNCPNSIVQFIGYIHAYDTLLPYIETENKDIYNSKFLDVEFLEKVILEADELKETKSFIREDHCDVLIENEKYLLLRPKTFRGSLKYGAKTKWCTSSRVSESTFNRYTRDGYLGYLISKEPRSADNFSKIALYYDYGASPLTGEISIYESTDKVVDDIKMLQNGWEQDEVFEIINIFRYYCFKSKQTKNSVNVLTKFKETIDKLDIDNVETHLKIVDKNNDSSFLKELQESINKFKNKLSSYGN